MSTHSKRDDEKALDTLGGGWRIRWTGPRYISHDSIDRKIPAPELVDTVMAKVLDAQIGHRTLKPHDDQPIRFRYLLRLLVSFDYRGNRYKALPVSWHHEFDTRESARAYCLTELGFEVVDEEPSAADLEHGRIKSRPGEPFELRINQDLPHMCWLSPDMPGKRLAPNFDIVISMDEDELQVHRDREKRSSPLLWGVKLTALVAIFVFLWLKYR